MAETEQILMRLEGLQDRVIPVDMFGGGWPIPDRLMHLPIMDVFVLYQDDIVEKYPDAVNIYRKTNESQITDEEIVGMTHVMRGAQYELER